MSGRLQKRVLKVPYAGSSSSPVAKELERLGLI